MVEEGAESTHALPRFTQAGNADESPRVIASVPRMYSSTSEPEVLQSQSLMAQWNARWDDKHVNSKDWRPEKNTIMVAGRPVGVLIVSHQGASPIEWDSYHNLVFYPLRPVILFGPTGMSVQAPKMQHKFIVIEWWKVIFLIGSPS